MRAFEFAALHDGELPLPGGGTSLYASAGVVKELATAATLQLHGFETIEDGTQRICSRAAYAGPLLRQRSQRAARPRGF